MNPDNSAELTFNLCTTVPIVYVIKSHIEAEHKLIDTSSPGFEFGDTFDLTDTTEGLYAVE